MWLILIPMLVGGTYLYIQAFLYGIAETPEPDWKLRNRLYKIAEKKGSEFLWRKLKIVDPLYADKIHPRDTRRIVRALEVFINSGKPFSSFHFWGKPRFKYVGVYLKRNWESLKTSIKEAIKNTLDQAKRQIRWFRKQGWYEVDLDNMNMRDACVKVVDIYAEAEEYKKEGLHS